VAKGCQGGVSKIAMTVDPKQDRGRRKTRKPSSAPSRHFRLIRLSPNNLGGIAHDSGLGWCQGRGGNVPGSV